MRVFLLLYMISYKREVQFAPNFYQSDKLHAYKTSAEKINLFSNYPLTNSASVL